MATYRQEIQTLVEMMDKIYDRCEYLRDCATDEEKKAWNDTRRIFYDAATPLKKLDNSLTQTRANTAV